MKTIESLYLSWRKGKGCRRIIVGTIECLESGQYSFSYLKEGISQAFKEGFTPYIDFPDPSKVYNENVIEIFSQRLIKSERTDIQKYLDFWEIKDEDRIDKYKLLAYTQGMLSTDNFEFLADFNPVPGLCFISEICGLSQQSIPTGHIKEGDVLTWAFEPGNSYDKFAVKVKKDATHIGYIKTVHSRVFQKPAFPDFKIEVKSVDQNGTINRVFIRISLL